MFKDYIKTIYDAPIDDQLEILYEKTKGTFKEGFDHLTKEETESVAILKDYAKTAEYNVLDYVFMTKDNTLYGILVQPQHAANNGIYCLIYEANAILQMTILMNTHTNAPEITRLIGELKRTYLSNDNYSLYEHQRILTGLIATTLIDQLAEHYFPNSLEEADNFKIIYTPSFMSHLSKMYLNTTEEEELILSEPGQLAKMVADGYAQNKEDFNEYKFVDGKRLAFPNLIFTKEELETIEDYQKVFVTADPHLTIFDWLEILAKFLDKGLLNDLADHFFPTDKSKHAIFRKLYAPRFIETLTYLYYGKEKSIEIVDKETEILALNITKQEEEKAKKKDTVETKEEGAVETEETTVNKEEEDQTDETID